MPATPIAESVTRETQPRSGALSLISRLQGFTGAERVLVGAIVLGVIARLLVIVSSTGSNDMVTWTYFADVIGRIGLAETYRQVKLFNHPPLMGWLAEHLSTLATATGIPFRICFKLPVLAADCVCLRLLWEVWRSSSSIGHHSHLPGRTRGLLALAIFACNPASILVTAFHGNTDSLCAVCALLAAVLHWRGQWTLAGVALAASVNVKISGLMWAPALFFLCPSLRTAIHFVSGFVAAMAPFLLPLVHSPEAFYRNAIAYNSNLEPWGINVLTIKLWNSWPSVAQGALKYREWGRFVIMGSILLAAVWARYRKLNVFQSASLSMVLFLLLTPGFGVQYVVWLVPVLAGTSLARSLLFGLSSGCFIGWVYYSFLTEEFPLRSLHNEFIQDPVWVAGLLTWFVLLGVLGSLLTARPVGATTASKPPHP